MDECVGGLWGIVVWMAVGAAVMLLVLGDNGYLRSARERNELIEGEKERK